MSRFFVDLNQFVVVRFFQYFFFLLFIHAFIEVKNNTIFNWTGLFFLRHHIPVSIYFFVRQKMIQSAPLKPRPAGKFIRLYLDGVVYEELKKSAEKNSKSIQHTAVLKIEEALGLKE
ncbi:hypothetical protein J3704_004443 [Salmonella enterica subsp. diarizonae serovar 61:z52:z53]|nr:hypothetical protein [Salmonella enterica subsp. diarizonae]EHG6070358.1 hypothetical protein [Salmonella enterica subsp. diarizonae serovar 61:z52:z53]EJS8541074.1 hypothetical protein [Salmonella enterica]EHG6221366.1 hypothetical protein [Salmonella enterica subsp. diarizonae serovar 61:z52:z53]EJS8566928.1 hypothetical protein [Salmonella enterica]